MSTVVRRTFLKAALRAVSGGLILQATVLRALAPPSLIGQQNPPVVPPPSCPTTPPSFYQYYYEYATA